jgi:hypothetical protein
MLETVGAISPALMLFSAFVSVILTYLVTYPAITAASAFVLRFSSFLAPYYFYCGAFIYSVFYFN